MNVPARRKPLALIFCYGFATALVGGFSVDAHAQAPAALRVDPALLGLPPLKPAAVPVPAPVNAVVSPVESVSVEASPIRGKSTASESLPAPAKAVAQERPEPVAVPQPEPVAPKALVAPVVSPSNANELERRTDTVPTAQKQLARPVTPQQEATGPRSSPKLVAGVSALPLLRVDPALLGAPPATESTAEARVVTELASGGQAPAVASSYVRTSPRVAAPVAGKSIATEDSLLSRVWDPVANAYNNGDWELYLPYHTHHLRSKYSAEKIATYQENPLGFGLGRGGYDEKGNWDGVYAMAFQDSHSKPMYIAGYGWKSIWRPVEDVRLGLGYTAALMSRSDTFGYVPFPVVLPLASLAYKNLSLEGTFVPGGQGNGNIFFLWAKWELGKKGEAIGTPARPVAPETPTQIVNTSFGTATPRALQRVPYGPDIGPGSDTRLTTSAETSPPLVPATGARDAIEVPDPGHELAIRSAKDTPSLSKEGDASQTVYLSAYRMGGNIDHEFNAEGEALLRRNDTVVNSDSLTYWPIDDEVEAEGNVRLERGGDVVTGPKMRLRLEDQIGYFEQPSYSLKRQQSRSSKTEAEKANIEQLEKLRADASWLASGFAAPRAVEDTPKRAMTEAHGDADRINFEGENQIRLINGTYTTCAPGNDDWYAKSVDLKLDYDHEVGDGKDGVVYFKGVPILYSPWLSFSLNDQRKSGFLSPTVGTNSDSGFEFTLPYYWNIAPNMDATIAPHVLSKRGVQMKTDFRYLNTALGGLYQGQARVEVLPGDKLRNGDDRYGVSLQHTQSTAKGFAGTINYNKVSDDNYYTDLSSGISSTTTTQLLQQAVLSYGGGGWWSVTANLQQYQTLQPDPKNPVQEPYKLLPQITVNARKPDFYLTDSSFLGQYSNFTRPDQFISGTKVFSAAKGERTVLYPQVALPYVTPGWYVTPKIGVNSRNYSGLSGHDAGTPNSISVTLPIASIDAGMTFERSSNWFGRDYTQTLEPRLYYLNIPYKDQSKIPLFDTGLADFNFAQIFSENQFSSWDRISNANQLTAAVTTRLLDPANGSEIMRAMLGQRFYFTQNKVDLNSTTSTTTEQNWDRSDILAAFSGQILPKVFADTAVQYNLNNQQFKRYSIGARYQPEPGKVLNAAYRYNRDATAPIDQVDFSGQWPLSGRWSAVARANYSFSDDGTNLSTSSQGGRLIESIAGLEYNGGCWVLRGVFQRIALTQESTTTSFFIQLELNDFARIGSNPINLLKRNIQGYSLINQSVADPVFGE